MPYNLVQSPTDRRKEFLNDIIKQGYDAYLFKTTSSYILISLTHKYKTIAISFLDTETDTKYYIECVTSSDEFSFKFFENEHLIDSILDQIYHSHSLKMINSNSFLNYFKKERGNMLFKQNYNWETIEYAGLLIRHKFYYSKTNEFAASNYIITILGNPIYFSPYIKKPFELEFFHSEKTNFRHIYPSDLFFDVDLNSYDGNYLIDLIMQRAFKYFFDSKEFVVMNYDELYYGKRSFAIPVELQENIHVFSIDTLKFYIPGNDLCAPLN